MNYNQKICSFTGYRASKLNACLTAGGITMQDIEHCLRTRMSQMLDEDFAIFRCGMANGADLLFAQVALRLREQYPGLLKFTAVIPCLDHDKGWRDSDRILCSKITDSADEVVLVSNSHYYDGCMAKRNRYLITGCDELIAVYDGQRGGTMQTINFAKASRIKVTVIDPSKGIIITLRESVDVNQLSLLGEY